MGYVIIWIVALLILPILFVLLTRRTGDRGARKSGDHGVTVSEPSSDQPTPGKGSGVNQVQPDAERRIPPG
jgi:hypothetical protein